MNAPVSNSARKLNGGQALAEMLKLSGVGPMFGMGGFQLLPFYEAVRGLGLAHYLINDERCGAFAADAYARTTSSNRSSPPSLIATIANYSATTLLKSFTSETMLFRGTTNGNTFRFSYGGQWNSSVCEELPGERAAGGSGNRHRGGRRLSRRDYG